jgi:hypothetical protein
LRYLLCLLLTLGFLTGRPLHSQSVTIYGTATDSAVVVLLNIVERDSYLVLDRDTVLDATSLVERDIVIVGARISLEGRFDGDVAVLDGDFFIRPRATVAGRVATLGTAGAYPSGFAEVDAVLQQDPRVFVSVGRTPDGYSVTITPPPVPPVLRIPSPFGLGLPTYDRVNGLSLFWGINAGFGGRDTATVMLGATVGYRALRGRVDGQLQARYRPSHRTMISIRAARGTRTTDSWIRGDLGNSLATLFKGSDVRDYFESEEVAATIERLPPSSLDEGQGFIAPLLSVRLSRDASVAAADPWALMGDEEWRLNPPIDEGILGSIVAGATLGWRGITSMFDGAAAIEWAPGGLGDFEFAQTSAAATWSMDALWRHRIGITGYVLYPVSREAPLQRWSFVGGPGTLLTLPVAHMRGDHVVYLNSVYLVPIRQVTLPLVGEPALRLEHTLGAAWRTGEPRPPLEQSLGAGFQLLIFKAMLYADPAVSSLSPELSFGVQLSGSTSIPIF